MKSRKEEMREKEYIGLSKRKKSLVGWALCDAGDKIIMEARHGYEIYPTKTRAKDAYFAFMGSIKKVRINLGGLK